MLSRLSYNEQKQEGRKVEGPGIRLKPSPFFCAVASLPVLLFPEQSPLPPAPIPNVPLTGDTGSDPVYVSSLSVIRDFIDLHSCEKQEELAVFVRLKERNSTMPEFLRECQFASPE